MNDRERSIHLSPVQVVASALASVTAAVLASLFGVAGTLIGAGVMSAAASVGKDVYAYWIRSTNRAIRGTIPEALKQSSTTARTLVGSGARISGGSAAGPSVDWGDGDHGDGRDPDNTNEVPSPGSSLDVPPPGRLGPPPTAPGPVPAPAGASQGGGGRAGIDGLWAATLDVARSLRWRNIAIATAVVFGLSMGTVTAVEALAKKPLSGIVGGSSPAGATTSVGGLVGGGQPSKPAPTSPSAPSGSTTTNPETTTPNGSSTTTSPPSTTPGGPPTTTPSTSPVTPPSPNATTPGSSGSSSGATSSGSSSSSGTPASGTASGADAAGG